MAARNEPHNQGFMIGILDPSRIIFMKEDQIEFGTITLITCRSWPPLEKVILL